VNPFEETSPGHNAPAKRLHVGIAGAGLLGRTLAWRLLRAGCQVTMVDSRLRTDDNTAAMVAAAMLSPLAELAISDAVVFAMGQRSMALWPQWIAQLGQDLDAPESVYFRQAGTLVVAHAADRGSFDQYQRLLDYKLPASHRPSMELLDAQGVAQCEPTLAGRFEHGMLLHGEGQLANEQWMAALGQALDRMGARWVEGVEIERLLPGQLVANGQTWEADVVVDARGIGSKPALPGLRGVRGEVLRVRCAAVQLQRPVRMIHPRYQIYVAPRPDHWFVVGATELESEDQGSVTLRSLLELGSALYSLHPGFGEARVERMSAALRPATDDDHAFCEQRGGVWHINGLYRHGYLCAPALVETLLEHLL